MIAAERPLQFTIGPDLKGGFSVSVGGIAIIVLVVAMVIASIDSYRKEKKQKAAEAEQKAE